MYPRMATTLDRGEARPAAIQVVVAGVAVAVPERARPAELVPAVADVARVAELAAAAMAIYVAIIRAREAARHEAQEDGGTHGSGSDRIQGSPFASRLPLPFTRSPSKAALAAKPLVLSQARRYFRKARVRGS